MSAADSIVPGWFSVKTAAAYTGFSVSAIESVVSSGRLPSRRVRLKGEKFARRIKREDLDAWIEGDELAAKAEAALPEKVS